MATATTTLTIHDDDEIACLTCVCVCCEWRVRCERRGLGGYGSISQHKIKIMVIVIAMWNIFIGLMPRRTIQHTATAHVMWWDGNLMCFFLSSCFFLSRSTHWQRCTVVAVSPIYWLSINATQFTWLQRWGASADAGEIFFRLNERTILLYQNADAEFMILQSSIDSWSCVGFCLIGLFSSHIELCSMEI